MLLTLLLSFLSLVYFASQEEVKCTEGLKARATLKYAECQDPLLPVKYCHQQYRDTLASYPRFQYDRKYPNKTHEDESCKTRSRMTSCEFLEHLTKVCGAHYDTCHTVQEKREIMRMWIKQFVRGTHEIYWEFAFADDNKEIIGGECNEVLKHFFKDEEIPEILSLINSGPNTYRKVYIEGNIGENETYLIPTKVSNLTRKFGVMVDHSGARLGYGSDDSNGKYDFAAIVGRPSHWKYCMWKMQHNIREKDLFSTLNKLFRCDGKCNTNDGDDQEWIIDSLEFGYYQINNKDKPYYDKENTRHWNGWPGEDLIRGDNSIFSCVWRAEHKIGDDVANNIEDIDKAKMGLCRPFKTLLENCSIPIGECLDNIAVKEIVMTDLLKEILERVKLVIDISEKHTAPNYFKGFTYNDCEIFGGDIAGASLSSVSWILITIVMTIGSLHTFKD